MYIARVLCLLSWLCGCAETPPDDVLDYASCLLMNPLPIEATGNDDPHLGLKSIYACNCTEEELIEAPVHHYPDGALIIKVSSRETQDFPWLLATMRKREGSWEWAEYTRNFADEAFARIPGGTQICTDCHSQVSGVDWVFTVYQPGDPGSNE